MFYRILQFDVNFGCIKYPAYTWKLKFFLKNFSCFLEIYHLTWASTAYLTYAALMRSNPQSYVCSAKFTDSKSYRTGWMDGHSNSTDYESTSLWHRHFLWGLGHGHFSVIYLPPSILIIRVCAHGKIVLLIQKTGREARVIVKKSPLTNERFAAAWQVLSDRYEWKVNNQIKTLFNLPPVMNERGTEIKKL